MIDQDLQVLLETRDINEFQHRCYMIFQLSDLGREFFRKAKEAMLMEESPALTSHAVMWHDGRKSVYRDFMRAIQDVEIKLKELEHGRNSNSRDTRDSTIINFN